ncbi:MAG: RidA family protein [Bacteroidota bacterium]
MEKHFINPTELPKWEHAFSQIVIIKTDSTQTIYLSGQVAVNQNNEIVGENDLKIQADKAFQNVETALSAVGATTKDVVKINIYVKDYNSAKATIVSEAFRKYFPHKNLPASTWLGVQALALDSLLIEIDVIAVIAS